MQQQLNVTAPSSAIVTYSPRPDRTDLDWLRFFDPHAALGQVVAHVETLPGSRHERHTMRAYLGSLADYCRWLGADVSHGDGEDYRFDFSTMTLPTKENTGAYIGHCKALGLTSSTVTRYMAAVRHFLRALDEQPVNMNSGADFLYVSQCQRQFRLAAGVKNPPTDRTSNRPALEQYGIRLSMSQVNILLSSFQDELDTLTGRRDLALLYLGISTGLRAAEIARLTMGNIQRGDKCYEIRVRGKRNNFDPVPMDDDAMLFIEKWRAAWADASGQPLSDDTPIFQPLMKNDQPQAIGINGYDPADGITPRAILQIIERQTERRIGLRVAAHDLRRTCAYLLRQNGAEWDAIRGQLRHRSIATTAKYVGNEQDLSQSLLSRFVTFDVPHYAGTEVQ